MTKKRCTTWELWVKFYLVQNEDCSQGGSISDSSERLLQSGSGGKSIYKIILSINSRMDKIIHVFTKCNVYSDKKEWIKYSLSNFYKFQKYNVDQNKLAIKEYLLNDSHYLKFKSRLEEESIVASGMLIVFYFLTWCWLQEYFVKIYWTVH